MGQTITITRQRPNVQRSASGSSVTVTGAAQSTVIVSRAGVPGPPGPTGPAGAAGGSIEKFTFSSPLSIWNLPHNLGREATISAYTPGGVLVIAEVVHLSLNTAQVIFDSPQAGFAIAS